MPFAKISQVAHYVPDQKIENDKLSQILDTSHEWIQSRTGIESRFISFNENTSDLASQVALQLIEGAKLNSDQIDFIIVATITPDSMMPSTAALVQAKIKASHAFAFDLSAACSGFVYALAMGEKLIASGQYKKGLVIGAEVISKTIDWSDRTTAVLFGDGAGGVLLEESQEKHFLAESLHTDGSRGQSLQADQKPLASPYSETSQSNPYLTMDGRSIFDFAIRDVSKSVSELINSSAICKKEIDYVFFHQANRRILDKMAQKIALPREKFLENMMTYGNTSAASIPILLSESVKNGKIKLDGSQTILLAGFGGGLTWGSLIVKI
ncbi:MULTISPECIES: beta-ketoacyl-ACP synthase III [Streptococcus]|uniref:Beta-ketoacyl-[acyl-carrier-protein] synthase III n=3 Tax=Streptococcus parauberis TaxID=1348 RepID=A0A2I8AN11_9STRE|nr:beta-ketoacyl-ACP synthase III [Streptococcus parauberis]AUT06755.1 Beta-ketoacyl-[acyl-carrier-protein] synthase III [Streptococcus parauberis]EGE54520.1 3-oxoacyl-(acyl carrier protein) synthase III [Streptococcus parauberis NCFD 2020]EMG25330.1 3-oxoacyl-[acyl-carrier-protein] synthase [Streptococcus parauberis KRS-02083]MDT2731505.1 ketoacyl-ACP synthase III [Streptococcus parauberis]MDT2749420.1 ketoacyl-ACP synthase III [Streptococcus parauberis]